MRRCYWCGLPNVRAGTAAARVAGLLEETGTWWTPQGIADRLGVSLSTAQMNLARLQRGGMLVSRRRPNSGNGLQYRWRRDT